MATPDLIPVSSSLIAAIGYSHGREELTIQFKKGDTYVYSGVPRDVYEDLLGAESVGKFFLQVVKRKYTGIKM
jgi:hypothetical protein